MIRLISELPDICAQSAEWVKLKCCFDAYKDIALFWQQDEDKCFISMLDGNMIIYNRDADVGELKEFIGMTAPSSIFSSEDTLALLGLEPTQTVHVMQRFANIPGNTESDKLSSRELYEMLNVPALSLPEYEYFAVDFCRRLNHGLAQYFGLHKTCAAISFQSGNVAILNGIVSAKKGFGSKALTAILQKNYGRMFFVCCRDAVRGFYTKNGFCALYKAAYWVKNK